MEYKQAIDEKSGGKERSDWLQLGLADARSNFTSQYRIRQDGNEGASRIFGKTRRVSAKRPFGSRPKISDAPGNEDDIMEGGGN